MKANMSIDFEEIYDQEADIYYVTFKTGEPSYAMEVDDVLILEVGMFTDMPTGFRILNYKKNPIHTVQFFVKKIRKTMEGAQKDLKNRLHNRENQIEQTLEKVLSAA